MAIVCTNKHIFCYIFRKKEGFMQELLDLILKKISVLEKKIEKYYQMLKIDNELTFIINGTYCLEEDVNNLIQGKDKEV